MTQERDMAAEKGLNDVVHELVASVRTLTSAVQSLDRRVEGTEKDLRDRSRAPWALIVSVAVSLVGMTGTGFMAVCGLYFTITSQLSAQIDMSVAPLNAVTTDLQGEVTRLWEARARDADIARQYADTRFGTLNDLSRERHEAALRSEGHGQP